MKLNRRAIISLVGTFGGAAILLLLLFAFVCRENSSKQTLSDGTVIVLSGLKIGRTNIYSHGTWLSKTIGRWAPSNGIALASFKLTRPTKLTFDWPPECEILSAQFRLLPGSPREGLFLSPPFYRKYRLLVSGDDGFLFVKEFNDFKTYPDGMFSYLNAWSFPRDSKQLRFRLEERDRSDSSDWHEMATFALRNPNPAQVQRWSVDDHPRFKLPGNIEIIVEDLTVRTNRTPPNDIWESMALLRLRSMQNGEVLTNWGMHHGQIWDASGNFDGFGASKIVTNDWIIYRAHRPLDPAKPWRFKAGFALDSAFPATNLFSFTVSWPMAGSCQTNLAGFPAQIRFVNQDMLSVELTSKPADMILSFVSAEDDAGTNLDDWSGSWSQHSFWKKLKLSKPVTVRATVAVRPFYPVRFTLQPRLETAKEAKPD